VLFLVVLMVLCVSISYLWERGVDGTRERFSASRANNEILFAQRFRLRRFQNAPSSARCASRCNQGQVSWRWGV